jgi:tRNA(Ile)-lysidine synthase
MDGNGDQILILSDIVTVIQHLTNAKKLWVGYSGGVDSHVLLDLVACAFAQSCDYQIRALHIHHGISDHADFWAQHCEQICAGLNVPLTVLRVDGNVVGGRSPEEMAREARFSAFEKFLKEKECLLLAHHEDDQAETILLRLFRGSGPLGLGGIPEKSALGQSELIRPLLKMPKKNILNYAMARNLQWIEDNSNQDLRFDRNFLRSEIMPLLMNRWPSVVRSITRTGTLCIETATAMQVCAKSDLETVRGRKIDSLSVSGLLALEVMRRRGVIRYWLQHLGFSVPSYDHMKRIDREVLKAGSDRRPKLRISCYEIRRQKDELSVAIIVKS